MKYLIFVSFVIFAGCAGQQSAQGKGNGAMGMEGQVAVNDYPVYDISDQDKANMLYMWEEEKLARDVYLELYDQWGHRVFGNISSSEQRHMDGVSSLLAKYGVAVKVDLNQRGVYSLPEIQSLYQTLVSRGKTSLTSAFQVGKEIEELDIADLKARMGTALPDAKAVYTNLLNGSYRHLEAFNRQLGN